MFEKLAGTWELSVGDTLIPAKLLGDLTPNYAEGTITAETQSGTEVIPSGKPETSEFTFTLFLPKENATQILGKIWPGAYNAPTAEVQTSGNLVFSSKSCQSREPQIYNIHNTCDRTDDNDIYIPAGVALMNFNPTLGTSAVVSVEITVQMHEDENGDRFRVGTGDLSQPSKYDTTTQKTVPVTAA